MFTFGEGAGDHNNGEGMSPVATVPMATYPFTAGFTIGVSLHMMVVPAIVFGIPDTRWFRQMTAIIVHRREGGSENIGKKEAILNTS